MDLKKVFRFFDILIFNLAKLFMSLLLLLLLYCTQAFRYSVGVFNLDPLVVVIVAVVVVAVVVVAVVVTDVVTRRHLLHGLARS